MLRLSLVLTLLATAPSCASLLPAPSPMRALRYPAPGPQRARCLVVLLPGVGDDAETFAERGFVEAVQARRLSADVVAAHATLEYYFRGTLWERLYVDVLAPERVRDYEQVWLLGISMGGMGVLMTARNYAGVADGLVLIAPYLGDGELAEEVAAAGGLGGWDPGPLPAAFTEASYQRQIWLWLKHASAAGRPVIVLGFGEADKLAPAARVLAAALPSERVFTAAGGHDWPPWQEILATVITRSPLAEACGPEGNAAVQRE